MNGPCEQETVNSQALTRQRLLKAVCHKRTPPAILDLVGRIQTQDLLANTALFVTWPCVASGGSFSLCLVCQMPKSNLI